ncbi:MAG: LexA family transcriptional regulator [Melioribacteraceae bacterium]
MTKKKSLGDRLRDEILKKNKSVRSFSLEAEIVPQQMQNYLTSQFVPGGLVLQKLSEMGINVNYVLTGNDTSSHKYPSRYNDFPVLSKIGSLDSGKYEMEADDRAFFNYPVKEKCFAIIVRGDSMQPALEDGDLVLVDANLIPNKNDIVAVRFIDGDQIIKRLKSSTKSEVHLISDNKTFDPLVINRSKIDLLAPIVHLHRILKRD